MKRTRVWNLTKSVLAFHFYVIFPALVGWLPAHTPHLAQVPRLPSQKWKPDRADPENTGVKPHVLNRIRAGGWLKSVDLVVVLLRSSSRWWFMPKASTGAMSGPSSATGNRTALLSAVDW